MRKKRNKVKKRITIQDQNLKKLIKSGERKEARRDFFELLKRAGKPIK